MDELYARINTYSQRKAQIGEVLSKISGWLPDDVEDVNGEINLAAQYLETGLDGDDLSEIHAVAGDMRGSRQPLVSADSQLSDVRESLEKEISRCDTVIAQAQAEIERLEAEAAAEEAARAQAEADNA